MKERTLELVQSMAPVHKQEVERMIAEHMVPVHKLGLERVPGNHHIDSFEGHHMWAMVQRAYRIEVAHRLEHTREHKLEVRMEQELEHRGPREHRTADCMLAYRMMVRYRKADCKRVHCMPGDCRMEHCKMVGCMTVQNNSVEHMVLEHRAQERRKVGCTMEQERHMAQGPGLSTLARCMTELVRNTKVDCTEQVLGRKVDCTGQVLGTKVSCRVLEMNSSELEHTGQGRRVRERMVLVRALNKMADYMPVLGLSMELEPSTELVLSMGRASHSWERNSYSVKYKYSINKSTTHIVTR